jgi:hypothetical protein
MQKEIEKKDTEKTTKFAQAIAKLRESGLTVRDMTHEGGCIGITGVHNTSAELQKATKLPQAIAEIRKSGDKGR